MKTNLLILIILTLLNLSLISAVDSLTDLVGNDSVVKLIVNKSNNNTETWPKLLPGIPVQKNSSKYFVPEEINNSTSFITKIKDSPILSFLFIGVLVLVVTIIAYLVINYNRGETITFDREFGGFGISE